MVLSSLVGRHDGSFVVRVLEPAINRCLYGDLSTWESSTDMADSSSDISNPTDVINWL